MKYPVVYCMEQIGTFTSEGPHDDGGFEATHTLFFCSKQCREVAITRRVESDGPYLLGTSGEWIDGTVCDECHKALA